MAHCWGDELAMAVDRVQENVENRVWG
jgi:hypothetical protein